MIVILLGNAFFFITHLSFYRTCYSKHLPEFNKNLTRCFPSIFCLQCVQCVLKSPSTLSFVGNHISLLFNCSLLSLFFYIWQTILLSYFHFKLHLFHYFSFLSLFFHFHLINFVILNSFCLQFLITSTYYILCYHLWPFSWYLYFFPHPPTKNIITFGRQVNIDVYDPKSDSIIFFFK